jgi:cytidylate kinase
MSEIHRIVTLDGPAGVGKTTLARRVAKAVGVAYLDTGAMFRSVAWELGDGSWEWEEEELRTRLQELTFDLKGQGEDSTLLLNGNPLDTAIRSEKAGLWASNVATLGVVREFLKSAQQAIGHDVSLVAEGRDMGTVVFPRATDKFFLDASIEERARRRYLQLQGQGEEADLDEIALQIRIRDAQDRNRPIAPLCAADDAVTVDTTGIGVEEVFRKIMEHMQVDSQ